MAPDLTVDLGLLETTAGSLGMLMEEFTNAKDIVGGYEAAIGAPRLVHAMHKFATNWKAHREDLVHSMDAVHQMVTSSYQAFIDADNKLAHDIQHAVAKPVIVKRGLR